MAANRYYNRFSAHQQPHQPQDYEYESSLPDPVPQPQSQSLSYTFLRPGPAPYGQAAYESAPSYHSQSSEQSNHNNENIALKEVPRLNVASTNDLSKQDDRSPLSPEDSLSKHSEREHRRRRRRSKKKQGFFAGPIPWVVYILSLIQITVFIYEIIKNSIVTGSPIMIHPQFNPMIGPSTYILINSGARFVPCMRTTPGVQDASEPIYWPCPNTTTADSSAPSNQCSLAQLCGMTTINFKSPNQWYRFIVPMFLHAGVIHIGFNMLLQLTMGREMEKVIGSVRFALVYFSSGIFGFVLGGNFAATAIASTGASGSLFGILALVLLDLLYCWQERESPWKDLMWIVLDVVISFVLGLLPGLDNFSHIGGFLMGLAAGICILRSPKILRQRIGSPEPYRNVGSEPDLSQTTASGAIAETSAKPIPHHSSKDATVTALPVNQSFLNPPRSFNFVRNRKPLWWAWWLIRAGALIGMAICFVVLLTNFYNTRSTCSWCKYLSCLPINGWCNIGNLTLTSTPSGTSKRDTLKMAAEAFVGGSRRFMRRSY